MIFGKTLPPVRRRMTFVIAAAAVEIDREVRVFNARKEQVNADSAKRP